MTYAGIDYDGDGVYIVLVDADTGRFLTTWKADLACGPGDAFARARRVRHLLPRATAWDNVAGVAIELPYSRFPASLVSLMRVQGAIVARLPRDLAVEEIRVQTWKKLTVGKSNADKAAVKAWALAQGAPDRLEVDFYDAFAIARACRHLAEKEAAAA
jgi:Holliday junction resolvasome RuvABC endonuclease subunit